MFSHPNTTFGMLQCLTCTQLEKHMVEVESSLFCFDPGSQMMSLLRRWEIGATFSKNTSHITIREEKGVEGS